MFTNFGIICIVGILRRLGVLRMVWILKDTRADIGTLGI